MGDMKGPLSYNLLALVRADVLQLRVRIFWKTYHPDLLPGSTFSLQEGASRIPPKTGMQVYATLGEPYCTDPYDQFHGLARAFKGGELTAIRTANAQALLAKSRATYLPKATI